MINSLSPYQVQAELFVALGHPARLKILYALRDGEACVCHIQAVLNQRQAYVSQHMNVLRNAGLVTARKEAQRVFYQVSDPGIYSVLEQCTNLLKSEGSPGGSIKMEESQNPENCHCPRCTEHTLNMEKNEHAHS